MTQKPEITVRNARASDRRKLADLIHFEPYVHRHLDWRPPLDWLGSHPFLLAEQNGKPVAALACSPDPPQVAWVRLFGITRDIQLLTAWNALWGKAYHQLSQLDGLVTIAAIPLHEWFESLLKRSGFDKDYQVVMLSWENGELPEKVERPKVIIRPMTLDDLKAVKEIDAASFVPVWQNSLAALEMAFRQAIIATVVEVKGQLLAYQISTATPLGGHLARLAVHPDWQDQGIGSSMLYDLLSQFKRRGAKAVTVNTQQNNPASLSLYKKAGFRLTGQEYPIYQIAPKLDSVLTQKQEVSVTR
jgi:ribosomal protein S18 acetylase RimI-like enzyme